MNSIDLFGIPSPFVNLDSVFAFEPPNFQDPFDFIEHGIQHNTNEQSPVEFQPYIPDNLSNKDIEPFKNRSELYTTLKNFLYRIDRSRVDIARIDHVNRRIIEFIKQSPPLSNSRTKKRRTIYKVLNAPSYFAVFFENNKNVQDICKFLNENLVNKIISDHEFYNRLMLFSNIFPHLINARRSEKRELFHFVSTNYKLYEEQNSPINSCINKVLRAIHTSSFDTPVFQNLSEYNSFMKAIKPTLYQNAAISSSSAIKLTGGKRSLLEVSNYVFSHDLYEPFESQEEFVNLSTEFIDHLKTIGLPQERLAEINASIINLFEKFPNYKRYTKFRLYILLKHPRQFEVFFYHGKGVFAICNSISLEIAQDIATNNYYTKLRLFSNMFSIVWQLPARNRSLFFEFIKKDWDQYSEHFLHAHPEVNQAINAYKSSSDSKDIFSLNEDFYRFITSLNQLH